MRMFIAAVAVAVVSGTVLGIPAGAGADTGGSRLYYVGNALWTAPAAHPGRRDELAGLHVAGAEDTSPIQVVPSPGDKRLAVTAGVHEKGTIFSFVLYVTGPNGRHQERVTRFSPPDQDNNYYLSTPTWSGEHQLFFSQSYGPLAGVTSALEQVHIPTHGKPGPRHEVPGSQGLTMPAVDPTSHRLAAVHIIRTSCDVASNYGTITYSIVVLNLRTHTRHRIEKVTTPHKALCPDPVTQLAWSPDGTRIAYQGWDYLPNSPSVHPVPVLKTVTTNGHHHRTRQLTQPTLDLFPWHPAWQTAHSLWFANGDELYSIRIRHNTPSAPRQRTHTPAAIKRELSFG